MKDENAVEESALQDLVQRPASVYLFEEVRQQLQDLAELLVVFSHFAN